MKRHLATFGVLGIALLLAAGCGSAGILGGGANNNNNTLRGTVDYVDASNHIIYLTNVSGYQPMLSSSGSGNTTRVYYDNQTTVRYQGQNYRPENLERGDEVDVNVSQSGSQLVADSVTVVRDVNAGGTSQYPYPSGGSTYPSGGSTYPYPSSSQSSTIHGTVRYVDTTRNTIEVDNGYGNTTLVQYDNRTLVSYNGRNYNPTDLERGDQIDVYVTDLGGGRYVAQQINVVRSVSDSGGVYGGSTVNGSAIRGTVRYVDTARRTIELEGVSGIVGYNAGAGTLVVQYPSNATIEINGRSGYPVNGLERGDVVEVQVDQSGNAYVANRIILLRDINQH